MNAKIDFIDNVVAMGIDFDLLVQGQGSPDTASIL